ncbi:hypothetical protein SAMN06297251_10640 [Fulvimarina manganoxydans]|uniref:Uncharacterized protein n=1 Tax=Fulvimarina manganoxydans TaxID=937218 RepID=A0A1W2BC31_9HYPH|nr:hypothetical protein [Fulvimarina manganoxydans]SMC70466.1 hypothetical protein SAMN06297251_10640 [Fulvimarina manganoxydans]
MAASSVYRPRTIKRDRRTAARIEQLDNQILAVLCEDHPQSVRHVFYRMTDPRLPEPVEKSDRGYRHVQDRVVKLRRSSRLPFGWITDATRRGYHTPTYRSEAEFLRSMKGHYRADLWRQSRYYCEVWCESRSIAGVIEDDCRELAVSLYPAGGFSSITLAYQSAETINHYAEGRPVRILYIGDYDPAGVLIDVALERELREHLNGDIDLQFLRIGITEDQIETFELPTKPRKETDRRALHVKHTVEAEAMPARLMRDMLRDQIELLLPSDALAVAKVEEQSAREYFDRLAEIRGSP